VTGHDSRELTIHADISGSESDNFKVTAEQTPSGVTVLGRSNTHHLFSFSFGPRVRFTVEVPRDYPVQLKTSGGALEVRGVNAELHGETSGGGIEIRDIGAATDMRTSGGHVSAINVKGSLRLRSSGGAIEVDNVTGDVDVQTSGGRIELSAIDGKITADTSGGAVRAEARSNHGIKLSSSGGPISLKIPANVHATLDAETSGGRVRSELPVTTTGSSESNRLSGTINGGGEPIHLHTSGGSIDIDSLSAH
jgi:DUF4097 and DUF4098 domain-containing protein YvlB